MANPGGTPKMTRGRLALSGALVLALAALAVEVAASLPKASSVAATSSSFSFGQLSAGPAGGTGCGLNQDGEPTAHVSAAGNVFVGSERGLGGGSDSWIGLNQVGGATADACAIQYAGQPNAVAGVGASGGDIDSAWASAPGPHGNYTQI